MPYAEPKVDPSARIASNATVIGDVTIGRDSTVLYGAVLRGDCNGRIIIGERTNIQDLACIHVPLDGDTVIGDEVTVGHGAILHGCHVGDGSLIGMGAILLDGAKVGEHCLVAAGALVPGKMDAPDHSLIVGSPAKVIRKVTDEELKAMSVGVEEYIHIGRELEEEGLL